MDAEEEEFLGGKKIDDAEKSSSSSIPLCGCLSVQYYRPFFDIDTKDDLLLAQSIAKKYDSKIGFVNYSNAVF